jgi:hypothetical protein
MTRRGVDLGGRPFLDHFALAHDHDPVADLRGHPQVVGDEQHGEVEALAHVVEQFEHLLLHRDVERRHRLVRDQHLGPHRERPGDADALALAAGELVRVALQRLGREADDAHQLLRARDRLAPREAEIHWPLDDGLAHGAARVERAVGVLEHDLDVAAMGAQPRLGQPGDVLSVDQHRAGGRVDQPHHAARDRGLARAGLADHPQRLLRADVEGDPLRRPDHAPAAEPAARAIGLEQGFHRERGRAVDVGLARGRRHRGHRADQHLRVGVPRVPQNLRRRALLDDPALAHHHDAVGDLGHHAKIMGDEQDARAVLALDLLDEGEDLGLRGDVEGGGRLVGDQQPGFERERHGDHDALALAARELVGIGVIHRLGVGQLHVAHRRDHAGAARGGGEVGVDLEGLGDLVADLHDRVQGRHRLLEDHRHLRAAEVAERPVGQGEQIDPVEADGACDRTQGLLRSEAHDGEGGDRLARAGLADDADDLALVDCEAAVLHRIGAVGALGERDGEAVDVENGAVHAGAPARRTPAGCAAM